MCQYFTLFNQILEKLTGRKGYKFNPRCFICDEGGTDFTGLKEVYGEDFVKDRVFGCQWHFKNDLNNKASITLDVTLKNKFLETFHRLCEATTVSKYNILKAMLDEMAKLYPDPKPWIAWWHARTSHIFARFRIEGLPKVNFSEIGNTGWKLKGGGTLHLATAAKKDISTMKMRERELEKFYNQEGRSTGKGPTKAVRDTRGQKEVN